jgi:hypothetical protein
MRKLGTVLINAITDILKDARLMGKKRRDRLRKARMHRLRKGRTRIGD